MFLFAALRSLARRRAVTGRQGNEGEQEEAEKQGTDVLVPPPVSAQWFQAKRVAAVSSVSRWEHLFLVVLASLSLW